MLSFMFACVLLWSEMLIGRQDTTYLYGEMKDAGECCLSSLLFSWRKACRLSRKEEEEETSCEGPTLRDLPSPSHRAHRK
jgi:hypothetical protein